MTDNEVHGTLVQWVAAITGKTTIKAHQSGPAPTLPYVMVNFTGSNQVRDHEQTVEYTDTGVPNTSGKNKISAAPVIEMEWRFSVHAYGPTPTDILRPIVSAAKLSQVMEPMYPGLVIHEVSRIRSVPDWIDSQWEPRAQIDIMVHGLTRDGFIIDTIDQYSLDIQRD
jgi:hypothetical protein